MPYIIEATRFVTYENESFLNTLLALLLQLFVVTDVVFIPFPGMRSHLPRAPQVPCAHLCRVVGTPHLIDLYC
jgi:hypothetical protein